MKFEQEIEISLLNDFYKNLLTDKQRIVVEEYVNGNNSLGEIAESTGITRQAVRDFLVKSEKQLKRYEEQLHLLQKFNKQKDIVDKLSKQFGNNELLEEILKVWEV